MSKTDPEPIQLHIGDYPHERIHGRLCKGHSRPNQTQFKAKLRHHFKMFFTDISDFSLQSKKSFSHFKMDLLV